MTKHNKAFNGSGALRAAGEWLTPFYPPAVLAPPPLKNGVMCTLPSIDRG